MGMKDRAVLLPESRVSRLSNWVLRERIRRNGQLVPVLYWRNELLDGERRLRLCDILHLEPVVVYADSEQDAARRLWEHHPRRAWERFVRERMHPRRIAWLFGCELSEIPTRFQLRDHLNRERRQRFVHGTERAALPGVVVARVELEKAHAACKANGTTLSAQLRQLVQQLASD